MTSPTKRPIPRFVRDVLSGALGQAVGVALVAAAVLAGVIVSKVRWGSPDLGELAVVLLVIVGAVGVYALLFPRPARVTRSVAVPAEIAAKTLVSPPVPVAAAGPKPWAATTKGNEIAVEVRVERLPTPWTWWNPELAGDLGAKTPTWPDWPYFVHFRVSSTAERVLSAVSLRVKAGGLCGIITQPVVIGLSSIVISALESKPVQDWKTELDDLAPRASWSVSLLSSQPRSGPSRLLWWVYEGEATLASGALPGEPPVLPRVP